MESDFCMHINCFHEGSTINDGIGQQFKKLLLSNREIIQMYILHGLLFKCFFFT